jgi:hypothetical protein
VAYDEQRQRISDSLDVELEPGRTVADAIREQFGHVRPDPRRTKLGIPEERAAADAALLAWALELYDRDYRRQPGYEPPTGITGLLPGRCSDA